MRSLVVAESMTLRLVYLRGVYGREGGEVGILCDEADEAAASSKVDKRTSWLLA